MVASQVALNGALEDVAIWVNEPPPVGRSSYLTDATPEPVSDTDVLSVTCVPPTVALAAGAVSDPDGAVLSMRTFARIGLVPVWPVPSVATTRKSYCPSVSVVVSSDVPQGKLVSLAIVTHEPPPTGRRSKSTCTESGSEEADSETVPLRLWPGSASVGVGEPLSTPAFRIAEAVELPAMPLTT